MRLKSEDILKPGAVMRVEKIDFEDPEVKKMLEDHHRECRRLKAMRGWRLDKHGWRRL